LKKISEELRYNFQNKTLEIQQEERNKLLGNVHDSFGGYLEALKLRLLHQTNNSSDKIQEILDSFYKEYRYLLHSLYAPKVNSENFIETLIEFCDKINAITGNVISYKFSFQNIFLYPSKCMHLYRIISELITNAIKYAKASQITIHMYENKEDIVLELSDNGVGFDINNIKLNTYGLTNIERRVEEMQGNFVIESKKNKGTNIIIKIPKDE
jgi:signal transduction histidine kinase